jgi:hypothetical protein
LPSLPGTDPASLPGMKPKSITLTLAGCAVLAAAALFPIESAGQAEADDATIQQLLGEIAAQQKTLAENQTKAEEKTAATAEEIRLARIFAGRTR